MSAATQNQNGNGFIQIILLAISIFAIIYGLSVLL